MDIKAPLKRSFFGVRCQYARRRPSDVTCIVVHQAQASTAESTAAFLHLRQDGSAHVAVDAKEGYLLADLETPTCGVKDVNHWTWHIEQAGFSSWARSVWLSRRNRRMMKRCAYQVARKLKRLGLPNRYLTTRLLDAGARRGWTTHRALSASRISSSVHTDPGLGFPRRYFGRLVRKYLRELAAPAKPAAVLGASGAFSTPAPAAVPPAAVTEAALSLPVPEPVPDPVLVPISDDFPPEFEPPCECGGPKTDAPAPRESLLDRVLDDFGLLLRLFRR
jgi:hypothetical protein